MVPHVLCVVTNTEAGLSFFELCEYLPAVVVWAELELKGRQAGDVEVFVAERGAFNGDGLQASAGHRSSTHPTAVG